MFEKRRWGSRVALLEREAVLPLDRTSPKVARQLVRDVLDSTAHTEWLDSAELAVSEIVTNAVLHAHTGCADGRRRHTAGTRRCCR